jgi:hypothetical protein
MREAFTLRRSARAEVEADPLPWWLATVRQLALLIRHPVDDSRAASAGLIGYNFNHR